MENKSTKAEALEVKEPTVETGKRKQGVTAKTLGALKEQVERLEESKLISGEDMLELKNILDRVRIKWIEKNL